MKIITERSLIQGVAAKWRERYGAALDDPFSARRNNRTPRQVAELLDALDGDSATAEEVVAIIGNETWTKLVCDECRKQVKTVVHLGDGPDGERDTPGICWECLFEAGMSINLGPKLAGELIAALREAEEEREAAQPPLSVDGILAQIRLPEPAEPSGDDCAVVENGEVVGHRTVILRVMPAFFAEMVTQGWKAGGDTEIECVKGLPTGAVCVDAVFDDVNYGTPMILLFFEHPDFDVVPIEEDAPEFTAEFVRRSFASPEAS